MIALDATTPSAGKTGSAASSTTVLAPLGACLALLVLACAPDAGAPAETTGGTPAALTAAPSLVEPAPRTIDEEVESTLPLVSSGFRVFTADNVPPGARLDPATGALTFRPDFTQSGSYDVVVTGHAGGPPATMTASVHVRFTVRNNIAPPAPVVVSTLPLGLFRRLSIRQTTDGFLDSPGNAGRTYEAVVTIPTSASANEKAPVVVALHGFGASPWTTIGNATTIEIAPHDPDNTYWWGYADSLPGAPPSASAHVRPYTARRVLHLIDWVLRTYPQADRDRVFSTGTSMGGGGAIALGLLYARHFAGIEATVAQAIARNHRPSRIAQLSTLWGSPELNLDGTWDTLDATRALRDDREARNQFVFSKHSKDDDTVHFGAAVFASPLTRASFYTSVEEQKIGHLSVWDEGSHTLFDPVMLPGWWDAGWSRVTDARSYLQRRTPFPAFTRSRANGNPGDGSGNGKVPFDPETGFSANVLIPGDTGWSGALAGAFNRFLRWDSSKTIDTRTRLVLPLRIVTGPGLPAPGSAYPTRGDLYTGPQPLVVDVTPRRAQAFLPLPNEVVRFRFGAASGTVQADGEGLVTIPNVGVTSAQTDLVLERDPL